jgi:hypothetical protein
MARAWVELMKRLGYSRFAAQGGTGAVRHELMALQAPPELIGIHVNFAGTRPLNVQGAAVRRAAPAGLSARSDGHTNRCVPLRTRPDANHDGCAPADAVRVADSPVALAPG